jgi:hypothetical protein
MSTIKKIGGRQYTMLREKRQAVLAAYRQIKHKVPAAEMVYRDLLAIHRSSELNSVEKDLEFKRYLQAAQKLRRLDEAAQSAAPVVAPAEDQVG